MFAILKTGGKQYKVKAGDTLIVEKLEGKVGATVSFDDVLLSGAGKAVALGKGKVEAQIKDQNKSDKVVVFKKKRRQNYRRTKGHRQEQTVLFISSVSDGKNTDKAEAKKATKPKAVKAEEKKAVKPEAKKAEVKKTETKKPAAKKTAAKKETK